MRSFPGTHMNQKGLSALIPVRADVMLANVISAACAMARFTANEPSYDLDMYMGDWFSQAVMSELDYNKAVMIDNAGEPIAPTGAELFLMSEFKTPQIMNLPKWAKALIGALRSRPASVVDYGACTFQRVSRLPDMRVGQSITPASGYPRDHLFLSEAVAAGMSVLRTGHETDIPGRVDSKPLPSAFSLPNPAGRYARGLASLLAWFDLHRLNWGMFRTESAKKIMSGPTVDKQWASSEAMLDFVQRLRVPAQAWLLAVDRFHFDLGTGIRTLGRRIHERKAPSSLGLTQVDLNEDRIRMIKTHPLLGFVSSMFTKPTTIMTPEGEAEAWLIPVYEQEDFTQVWDRSWDAYTDTAACNFAADVAQLEAIYTRYVADTIGGNVTDPCRQAGWGWLKLDGVKVDKQTDGDFVSYGRMVSAVMEDPAFMTRVNETTDQGLHWTELRAELDKFDALGADMSLTNGFKSSKRPAHVIMGLTPNYSLGNRKRLGLGVRLDQHFGSDDRAQFITTSTVRGKVTSIPTRAHFEQQFIPSGMWMGEAAAFGLDAASEALDELPELLRRYYASRGTDRYLQFDYPDLDPRFDTPDYRATGTRQSSWDEFATNFFNGTVTSGPGFQPLSEQIVGWKDSWETAIREISSKADRSTYRHIPDGAFYMRVNIIMARADYFSYVTTFGHVRGDRQPFRHTVIFDNDLEATNDMSELDVLLQLFPVEPLTKGDVSSSFEGGPL